MDFAEQRAIEKDMLISSLITLHTQNRTDQATAWTFRVLVDDYIRVMDAINYQEDEGRRG